MPFYLQASLYIDIHEQNKMCIASMAGTVWARPSATPYILATTHGVRTADLNDL